MTSFAPYDPSMGITSDQYYQWMSAADPMSDTYNSSYTGPKPSVSFPKREFGNPDRGGLVSLLDPTGEIGRRSEFDPGRTGLTQDLSWLHQMVWVLMIRNQGLFREQVEGFLFRQDTKEVKNLLRD